MSQKLSVRGSESVKNTSQFTGDFITIIKIVI